MPRQKQPRKLHALRHVRSWSDSAPLWHCLRRPRLRLPLPLHLHRHGRPPLPASLPQPSLQRLRLSRVGSLHRWCRHQQPLQQHRQRQQLAPQLAAFRHQLCRRPPCLHLRLLQRLQDLLAAAQRVLALQLLARPTPPIHQPLQLRRRVLPLMTSLLAWLQLQHVLAPLLRRQMRF